MKNSMRKLLVAFTVVAMMCLTAVASVYASPARTFTSVVDDIISFTQNETRVSVHDEEFFEKFYPQMLLLEGWDHETIICGTSWILSRRA